ncbi:endopeptidase La [Thermosulfuriphilus ammonigenes]|uniref:Lon protease n=1 Tax=Thermosulfuriphilus ammonigenes TaxID=1936021 RepID=A0A6G7PVT6_9BACT|nr:endopeptidase La [Thermosulfuriphilus ammonigenes]MBA2848283.1 ATP-dependent Lon protease [Thermosulfuriphilus ammonigenes]QIJ71558.1 endopeptidase La [Thermosulfuriphilus ammonigenes]
MIELEDSITSLSGLSEEESIEIPEELPLMAVRDVVIFPSMIIPLFVGREASISAVNEAIAENNRLIALVSQKDGTEEEPSPEDLYSVGVVAIIMRTLKLPDGRLKILIQAITRAQIKEFIQTSPHFRVKLEPVREEEPTEVSVEIEALMRNVRENAEKIFSLKGMLTPEISSLLEGVEEPGRLADIVVSNLRLRLSEAQKILETFDPIERLRLVNEVVTRELEVSAMQAKIQSEAKEEMTKTQREYFLREQLRAIKKELGEIDEHAQEIEEFREKILKARMPKEVEAEALKQLRRLELMHPDSAEASVVRTYLEWLVELPWRRSTRDKLDLKAAKRILDEDHYNLEKVKERILEFLAVRKLSKTTKGPIICFVGPPGVGKTSLGRSIARAMGRKFIRISLGGVRDEAEIRGHRRTYIGALPGRIIQGLKTAGTNNPVFMIDEIDKLYADFQGDPSAALLEVLDPEQNSAFVDHYLGVPFDLSRVMFIATANMVDTIPPALRDRMEIIYISGYTAEEKLIIARKYLLPRQAKEHGLSPRILAISDETILKIIEEYTEEAGLRELERQLAALYRKVARRIAEGQKGPFRISRTNLHKYLGPPRYIPELEQEEDEVGVATGLAWTQYGGEVLYVEASVMVGKGNLILTGQLGEVMKESAQAALSYTRTRAQRLGIDPEFYDKYDIHVHVPAGAIPKDGPSAGVTMAIAMISALTETPVSKDIAMTGEITLRGRVLPVGGIKEKALAALRKKIHRVIIPEKNLKDLEEIPRQMRRRIEFIPVRHVDQILELTLLPVSKKKRRRRST